jgi:sulfur-oxidizing protein SoxA
VKRALALVLSLGAACVTAEPYVSGTRLLSEELAAQQLDEAANPGMLWVEAGERLWQAPAEATDASCRTCHGEPRDSMRGVATRYPAWDADAKSLLNLEGRINRCRTKHQRMAPLAYETDELLALTALVARQSLGMPIRVTIDGPAARDYAAGAAFYRRRQGQLNLSCANCHDDNFGKRLRGDVISHGVPTGYPIYRLEWQSLGSLHRRLRACSLGVRAVQFAAGSPEYLGLELYLAKRAQGLFIETPAIRR